MRRWAFLVEVVGRRRGPWGERTGRLISATTHYKEEEEEEEGERSRFGIFARC